MPAENPSERGTETRKSSNRTLLIIIGALLLVVVLLAVGKMANMNRGVAQQPIREIPVGPAVAEHKVTPPPLAPPVTEMPQVEVKPGEPPKQPPAEVVRYLQHLKNVETYRQNMRNDIGPALMMLKDAYASQLGLGEEDDFGSQRDLKQGYSKYIQDWQNLTRYFLALPPPEPCSQLAYEYGEGLRSYVSVMSSVQIAMGQGDISSLLKLRGSAQGDVNQRLKNSDAELERICETFGIKKEFRITEDTGVGSLIGL